jgi:hypothetical protein
MTDVAFSLDARHIWSPVYYASLLGLDGVLPELMNICQDHPSERRSLINAQGGEYGSALQAASKGGHDKVVQCTLGDHSFEYPIYDADSGKRRVAGS